MCPMTVFRVMKDCLTFSNSEAITVTPQEPMWPGDLKYSTDKTTRTDFKLVGADGAGAAFDFKVEVVSKRNGATHCLRIAHAR